MEKGPKFNRLLGTAARSHNNPLISPHAGGVHVLLADGSARMISNSINMITLRQLVTRDDGQIMGEY